jgi:hypothetical protein
MTVCLLTIHVWSIWRRANCATRLNSSYSSFIFLRSRFQNSKGRRNFPFAYSQMYVYEVFQPPRSRRKGSRSSNILRCATGWWEPDVTGQRDGRRASDTHHWTDWHSVPEELINQMPVSHHISGQDRFFPCVFYFIISYHPVIKYSLLHIQNSCRHF